MLSTMRPLERITKDDGKLKPVIITKLPDIF